MPYRLLTVVFVVSSIVSCVPGEKQMRSPIKETHRQSMPIQEERSFVSDTVKQIINELDLCQYSEHVNVSDYYSCYDKDVSDIRRIKKDDKAYKNFLFQAPGGSAGGALLIFVWQNGKYKEVQKELGYIIDVLPSSTNGFFDLVIWHRAKKAGGEYHLYKWNNEKYISKRILKNYDPE